MAWQESQAGRAASKRRRRLPDLTTEELFGLIRSAHIFGSAVQELLEVKLLEGIGADHLTVPQLHLLQLITVNGQHQIGQIADFLGVSPPAATKNVDKLARLGLVTRKRSELDRRATLLAASAAGRKLIERFQALKLARLEPVLEEFDADEVAQLEGLLERFATALIRSEGSLDGLCLRCSAHFDAACPIRHFHDGCPYQKLAASGREGARPPAN